MPLWQTTASPPQESHLSALTSDPLWQCVRKGTSPAFSPGNMRCLSSAPVQGTAHIGCEAEATSALFSVKKGGEGSCAPRRNGFAEIARTSQVLVDTLHRVGAETPVNIDVAIQACSLQPCKMSLVAISRMRHAA